MQAKPEEVLFYKRINTREKNEKKKLCEMVLIGKRMPTDPKMLYIKKQSHDVKIIENPAKSIGGKHEELEDNR